MDGGDLKPQLQFAATGGSTFVDLGIWLYRHIWKSGGTSMQNLPTIKRHQKEFIQQKGPKAIHFPRHIFTFVRDPIDHFISGFKESGKRRIKNEADSRNMFVCFFTSFSLS